MPTEVTCAPLAIAGNHDTRWVVHNLRLYVGVTLVPVLAFGQLVKAGSKSCLYAQQDREKLVVNTARYDAYWHVDRYSCVHIMCYAWSCILC